MRAMILLCSACLVGSAMAVSGALAGSTGGAIPAAPDGAAGNGQPAAIPAEATADPAALEATTAKFNSYVAYMNRTLRAVDSLARYRSWVKCAPGRPGASATSTGSTPPTT